MKSEKLVGKIIVTSFDMGFRERVVSRKRVPCVYTSYNEIFIFGRRLRGGSDLDKETDYFNFRKR